MWSANDRNWRISRIRGVNKEEMRQEMRSTTGANVLCINSSSACARARARAPRKTSSTETSQSSFNALWSSGGSSFTRVPARFSPLYRGFPRRRRRMRSRMPWPLTFKNDLRKAFESLLAARFRYRSRILRGLFDLREPSSSKTPRRASVRSLSLCARRFAAVASAFIPSLRTLARQNARILPALWKRNKYDGFMNLLTMSRIYIYIYIYIYMRVCREDYVISPWRKRCQPE